MRNAKYRIISLSILLLFIVVIPAQGQETTKLEVGRSLKRNIDAGGKHIYLIDLGDGKFVYGDLDQISVDVVINIFNPDGEKIGNFDVYDLQERFHVEAADAGTYRIEVSHARGKSGDYIIEIKKIEPTGSTSMERMDQFLRAYYKDDEPGGVVSVMRKGEIIYSRAFGMANLTHRIPFTINISSNIGSVSKQFTGFAIALLEKEGKLSFDDDIRKYIPELPDYGTPVTLLNLLNHTSGFRDIWQTFPMQGKRGLWSRKELIQSVQRQQELQNVPGTEYRYCNTDYILLAEVVERVSGLSFPKWMEANVFAPLGMKHTTIKTEHGQVIPNSAQGYTRIEGGYKQCDDSDAFYGASGIYTTVGDLSKWLQNFRDSRIGGPEVISRLTEHGVLKNGDTLNYALGLNVDTNRGLRCYSHGGTDGGQRSNIIYYPDIDVGIILLNNEKAWSVILDKIIEEFIGEFQEIVQIDKLSLDQNKNEPAKTESMPLHTYAGRYAAEEDPRLVLTVVNEDKKLRVLSNYPELPSSFALQAISDSTFSKHDIDFTLNFQRDAQKQIVKVILRWRDGNFTLRRLPPYMPSKEDLSVYTGLYYSSELNTVYTIFMDDNILKIRFNIAFPELPLMPKTPDLFADLWLGEYRFERNDDDKVTGFVVQNIHFKKVK